MLSMFLMFSSFDFFNFFYVFDVLMFLMCFDVCAVFIVVVFSFMVCSICVANCFGICGEVMSEWGDFYGKSCFVTLISLVA